jgi:YHS domain-containing protein
MVRIFGLVLLITVAAAIAGDKPDSQQQAQLTKLQALVGSWRGVAQPQRGSAKDSWTEQADWSWDFSQSSPALIATLSQGKYFSRFRLTPSNNDGEYHLAAATSKDEQQQAYSGLLDDQNQFILLADQPREDLPRRLTFRFTAGGDRLLLLMEKQGPAADSFLRIAEIGYTRAGSGFGNIAQGRECILTGGLGTIEVSHNGKTYHVCCTGCRDYFNANPEQTIAEYAAKKQGK